MSSEIGNTMTREERFIYAQLSRRGFMGATAAATLAALTGREPVLARSATRPQKAATADSVIVLWMAGGMAQTETFDPKRYTPFERGVKVEQVLSTFPAIPTAVDHIKFTAGLEQIASVMDRGAIIRSFMAADLGFILHSRHQYHWHTGYIPPQPMAMPHLGAVVSKTLGAKNPDMPAFIAIGQTVEGPGEIGTLKAFHTAGFLGSDHGPFLITDPKDAASAVRPPKELGEGRFRTRRQLFEKLLAHEPVLSVRRRIPARSARQVARCGGSSAVVPLGEGVRCVARAGEDARRVQDEPLRAGLPAGAPAGRSGRQVRRGHVRVHSRSCTGTHTKTDTSASWR